MKLSLIVSRALAAISFIYLGVAPRNCDAKEMTRYFPRDVELLKSSYIGPYQRSIVENDYFIFGDSVSIDTPIITNGGDVTIFASDLTINAPIDTRIRVKISGDYWTHNVSDQEWNLNQTSLFNQLQFSPDAMSAFDSLYKWREIYDPATKEYKFGVFPASQISEPEQAVPQLPSGRVPLANHVVSGPYYAALPTNGEDAPDSDVIWEHVSAGRIRIYANSIKLCSDCERVIPSGTATAMAFASQPPAPQADDFEPSVEGFPDNVAKIGVFFQAAGTKGGRGGAGTVTPCPGQYNNNTGCGNVSGKDGGLSGMPGRGGNAGAVEFHFVNSRPGNLGQLLRATSVAGGRPAQRSLKKTPSWAVLTGIKNRNAFTDASPVPNVDSLFGKSGTTTVDYLNSNQAINDVARVLLEASVGRNYSISMILQRARTDSNPSLDPKDIIRDFLITELRELQRSVLTGIAQKVNPSTGASSAATLTFPPILATLDCDKRKELTALSDPSLYIIDSICHFSKLDGLDAVQSYLALTGGILRTDLSDIRSLEYFNSMSKDMLDMKGLMRALIDESIRSNLFVFTTVRDEQKQRLSDKIGELEQKVAELNAKGPTVSKTTDTLVESGKALGKDVGKLSASIGTEDWLSAALGLGDVVHDLQPFLTNDIGVFYPDTADIAARIAALRQSLSSLLRETEATRTQMLSLQNANLARFVELQSDYARIDVSELKTFDSAVSLALQSYVANPGRGGSSLDAQFETIRAALDGYYQLYAQLNVQPLRDSCSPAPAVIQRLFDGPDRRLGCELVSRADESYVVMPKAPYPDIPLLLVQKGSGSFPVSFGLLLGSNEIRRLNVKISGD